MHWLHTLTPASQDALWEEVFGVLVPSAPQGIVTAEVVRANSKLVVDVVKRFIHESLP